MKTTVKRTLSLLLAAASMASVLTACGSKDTRPQLILPQIRRQSLLRLMLPIWVRY